MNRRNRRIRDRQKDEYADYFDEESSPQPTRKSSEDRQEKVTLPAWSLHLAIIGVVAVLLLSLIGLTAGRTTLEKTLQALLAPAGLLWMGLFLTTYFSLLNRQGFPAFLAFSCWILLSLSGNAIVASLMMDKLQEPYANFETANLQKLDVVIVLGGGLMTLPNGKPQINDAGDRAMQAYLLFKAGKVDRIICSGVSGLPLFEGQEMDPGEALESLLISMGIPQEKIITIGGRNTYEEFQAFDQWITENAATSARKGIITSAWHLPRAMRLANSVGIQAEPIPADFSGTRLRQSPALLIPSSDNMETVRRCLKEWMARLVGR